MYHVIKTANFHDMAHTIWRNWGANQFSVCIGETSPDPQELPPLAEELLILAKGLEEFLAWLGGAV